MVAMGVRCFYEELGFYPSLQVLVAMAPLLGSRESSVTAYKRMSSGKVSQKSARYSFVDDSATSRIPTPITSTPWYAGGGILIFFLHTHTYFPASGQAVVIGVVPSSPRSSPSFLSRKGFSNPTARRFFIECC